MNASTTEHQDPFAPIERVLLSTPGQEPKSYSVRAEDPTADNGWREVGVSPPGHLLVTNQELYCMADEIASRSPFDWRGVRLFFDGQRFAYALSTDEVFEDVGGREALSQACSSRPATTAPGTPDAASSATNSSPPVVFSTEATLATFASRILAAAFYKRAIWS